MDENKNPVITNEKQKVLIVDDIPKNLQIVGNRLSQHNIDIGFATSGTHAIKAVAYTNPDLILLDVSMPEMDGFEVCKQLKENKETKHIPIIFLTARTEPDEIIKGFELGAVDYITKPFNNAELVHRVLTHLELKRSRDTIEKQNKELKKLNGAKDRLFSIISHDLRGPLGNFRDMLDILISRPNDFDSKSVNEILELLKDSANSTYNLLDNLLNWSKSQQGTLSFQPSVFNIGDLISENILVHSGNAEAKQIAISHTFTDELPVKADKNMISLILRNLIGNAIKFTHLGGRITVDAKKIDDQVEIYVSDNGVGIDAENMKKLFNVSQHFTTFGTSNEKGSGLGLILCKEFIEKNNGEIYVESEVGKGSSFYFRIPAGEEWMPIIR